MKPWGMALFSFILLVLSSGETFAHKPSDSYLRLTMNEDTIQGQWDIALRDLDHAIGLDGNADGAITWEEVRAQHHAIAGYALSRLQLNADDTPCSNHMKRHLIDHHSDGAYAVLQFSIHCPTIPVIHNLNYRLFFDIDPLHRGLLQVTHPSGTQTAVLSPEQPSILLNPITNSVWREFLEFGREGVWHIWIGYDHILFLISLLLPAVMWWKAGQWQAVDSFKPALREVLSIITAFTLAHSLTLSLAALELFTLPSQWVESVIAGSVVLAALHNVFPIFQVRRWMVGFVFGLIHGFGFASVLADLRLPASSMFVALAGFNIGVEAGQLVIVGAFLPLAYAIRHSWTYRYLAVQFGSVCIAVLAFIWFIERSLDLQLTNWLQ
ncbi:MAG: HupE/UreJ family protein [Nitrospirales bacterium]